MELPLEEVVKSFTYDNTSPVDADAKEIKVNTRLLFCSEGEDPEAQLNAMWRNVKSLAQESFTRYKTALEIKQFQKSTPFAKAETLANIYGVPVEDVRTYLKMTDEEIFSLLNDDTIHNMVQNIPDKKTKPLKKKIKLR